MSKIIIVGIMGKSASGKSTYAKKLILEAGFHMVKSYTTRSIREEDPEDKNTHIFVDVEYFNKVKKEDIVALYESPDGYFSWTDISSFQKDKVNVYAIDPMAFINMRSDNRFIVEGIYVDTPEDERAARYYNREGTYEGFKDEPHLDKKHLSIYSDIMYIETNEEVI